MEVQTVRADQSVAGAFLLALEGQTDGGAVEMGEAAGFHLIAAEHLQQLRTAVALVEGRVVEKDDFFPLAGGFQAQLQPLSLP